MMLSEFIAHLTAELERGDCEVILTWEGVARSPKPPGDQASKYDWGMSRDELGFWIDAESGPRPESIERERAILNEQPNTEARDD